ncbi:MAG TPA: hypothetical protein VHI52_18030 [Verrucomicrobiae bacterium]|nr:hypothetical protein [Verrucomicrobiae bacterium]
MNSHKLNANQSRKMAHRFVPVPGSAQRRSAFFKANSKAAQTRHDQTTAS